MVMVVKVWPELLLLPLLSELLGHFHSRISVILMCRVWRQGRLRMAMSH